MSQAASSVSLEFVTEKISPGQVSLEYFGVPCQYESTILTFHPHIRHAIQLNLATYSVVTWKTFSTEMKSLKFTGLATICN